MDDEQRARLASDLLDQSSLTEAMVVATCNRVEVYVVTTAFHTGVSEVVEVLHQFSGVDLDYLRQHLYVRYADAAAEHMLCVSAGLDSMVLGEQQIIGQVRIAYQQAGDNGTAGPNLHALAQTALHTGKRVHTETQIDDAGASMVSFAVDAALEKLGCSDLSGRAALVMGAGAMSSLAATYLGKLGVDTLIIANRTRERAETMADHARQAGVRAEVVDFADRASVLDRVDVAVSATGSETFTIARADLPARISERGLMLVDLSMPRDIDDACTEVDGVDLVNIERLTNASEQGRREGSAAQQAMSIVAEELERYTSAQRVRDVVPAVAALRKHAAGLIDAELNRLAKRTPNMTDEDRTQVAKALHRVVEKILHQPTVRVKQLAAQSGTVSYESALQELFGVGEAAPTPVAVAAEDLPTGTVDDLKEHEYSAAQTIHPEVTLRTRSVN